MHYVELRRAYDGGLSATVFRQGKEYALNPCLDVANHSPTGFEVGYGGSGPHQLALAILTEFYDTPIALHHYHDYVREVLCAIEIRQPGYRHVISKEAVDQWIVNPNPNVEKPNEDSTSRRFTS